MHERPNNMKLPVRILLTAAVASAALVGCKSKAVKPMPPSGTTSDTTTTNDRNNGGRYTVESLDTDSCLRQRVVHFDFDRAEIKSEFQAQIACHAAYLRQFPSARVTLEGNADERGTREYNLGLRERRGNAVS